MLKIISANRLSDGVVVYFIAPGSWTADINQATCFATDDEIEAGLGFAKLDEKSNLVLDPFAVAVETQPKSIEALSLRNSIRAKGPTINYLPRPDATPRS